MSVALVQAHSTAFEWPDALLLAAAVLGEPATVLALEREHVHVGRLDGDASLIGPAGPLELERPWQLRVFSPRAELRWSSAPGLPPRAALLLEAERPPPLPDGWHTAAFEAQAHEVRYLLWGEQADGAPEGWVRLTTSRIGSLEVPLEARSAGRVQLLAREYHGTTAEDPLNTVVIAERWCALAPEEKQ